MDEVVGRIFDFATGSVRSDRSLQEHTFADLTSFQDLLQQRYEVQKRDGWKNSYTVSSFDGLRR